MAIIFKRLYIPIATFLLIFVIGDWIAGSNSFDPMTAAQNKRITFQSTAEGSRTENITYQEDRLAKQVLDNSRKIIKGNTHLLYLGNSQTLAIMDKKPGDMTSPQWLQIFLSRNEAIAPPIDVYRHGLPNLTMTEFLIKTVSFFEPLSGENNILIGPVILEEFRGLGVRDDVANLAKSSKAKNMLQKLVSRNPDLPLAAKTLAPCIAASVSDTGAIPATGPRQKKYEQYLQRIVEKIPLFSNRENLRGTLYVKFYKWRNKILSIDTSTARAVPEECYKTSIQLTEMVLRYVNASNIKTAIYLAPIRPVKPNPNVDSDVMRFRTDVPVLCGKYRIKCLDFTDLIPEKLWTNYPDDKESGLGGQRDFAHFTGKAHKLLAKKLTREINAATLQTSKEAK